MKLLAPLGLLGLLSIVALIIIYIIRPNYQQKMISTTFMWKLSLKRKKKKLPTSKLRNILLIICQVLILTASTMILAQPATETIMETNDGEVIAVIDSSASMRTQNDLGESRFDRAINQVLAFTNGVFEKNGVVSVIIANESPYYLMQRETAAKQLELETKLNELLDHEEACSWSVSDVESAMKICETIIDQNPKAQVYFYTDTAYDYVPKGVNVVDVSEETEWNVAILNAYTEMNDNYYTFYVDMACYGRNEDIELSIDVHNANPEYATGVGRTITYTVEVPCYNDETMRVVFINSDLYQPPVEEDPNTIYYLIEEEERIYSYEDVLVAVSEDDSSYTDNTFSIYGGQKPTLKIQYASSLPNPFFSNILLVLKEQLSDRWNIQVDEVKKDATYETSGYDFYVFEHLVPSTLPEDGVVFLADPESSVSREFTVEREWDFNKISMSLMGEDTSHPIMSNVAAENITVTRYKRLVGYDTELYTTLMSCDGYPTLLAKNELNSKIVIMPFSVHHSNMTILMDFPIFMYNMFQYYFPATVTDYTFEVNEQIAINSRSETLSVYAIDGTELHTVQEFPSSLSLSKPGTYTLTQANVLTKEIPDISIFVGVPMAESNIWSKEETFYNPYSKEVELVQYDPWLVYIAAALVFLVFVEWWLQSRENM